MQELDEESDDSEADSDDEDEWPFTLYQFFLNFLLQFGLLW